MVKKVKQIYIKNKGFLWMLAVAFVVKSLMTQIIYGHESDMLWFTVWPDAIYECGFSQFYSQPYLTDYPPGYMYILYFTAWIRYHILGGVAANSSIGVYLLKVVPIIFELFTGALIYKIALKEFSAKYGVLLSMAYLFNPAVWVNSSLWGQVDSVYTFFVVFMCYLCQCKKRKAAYFAFAAGILLKPQTMMFAPVILYSIIEQVFMEDFTLKKFFQDLFSGLAAIGCMILVVMPYGLNNVIEQYKSTMESYPFASVNAYNFWALIGQNYQLQTGHLFGIQYQTWGTVAIFAAVILSAIVFFKSKGKDKYYSSMALLISLVFTFSVRMHERYLFPVMVLIMFAYIVSSKKYLLWAYTGFSLCLLINEAHVLYLNIRYYANPSTEPVIYITAILLIVILLYYMTMLLKNNLSFVTKNTK